MQSTDVKIKFFEQVKQVWDHYQHQKFVKQGAAFPLDDPTLSGLSSIIAGKSTPPQRHVEDLLIAYSRLPWLRAVVGKIGFSVASVEWQLFFEKGRGGSPVRSQIMRSAAKDVRKAMIRRKQEEGELEQVPDHVALEVLHSFNPMMTGLAAKKLTQVHIDLVGEAFWLKQRDGLGTTVGLWPIPPPWIRSTPSPAKPFYEIQVSSWTAKVPMADMVWFMDTDPARPYWRGKGTAEALGDELETDEFAAKHTKVEFYNRAIPELLISADGMSDTETRRMETDWKQRNQGVFKALQVHFMNRKVDVKQLGQTFKSLQLIQLW